MIARTLTSTLQRALRTFPAVVVTGARQAGKTTLFRNELRGHRCVSLDEPDRRARALADPVGALAEPPPPVILDEIHHAPARLSYIKARLDVDRRPGAWVRRFRAEVGVEALGVVVADIGAAKGPQQRRRRPPTRRRFMPRMTRETLGYCSSPVNCPSYWTECPLM